MDQLGPLFVEHSVYVVSIFHVIESMSGSVCTQNKNKIILCWCTNVDLDDGFLIHQYALRLSKSGEINKPRLDYTYLVGIISHF